MKAVTGGMAASMRFVVSDADTALALGSGSVPALATPRLVAWLEAAAVEAIGDGLEIGSTSVGIAIDLRHLAATSVGGEVEVSATITAADTQTIEFSIEAKDDRALIATGTHTRAIVDESRFLGRL